MRENQRVAQTKRLLGEGLLELLETKELDKVTVTELCRVAGVNRATFYRHYASVQALLEDVAEGILRPFFAESSWYREGGDIREGLEALCVCLWDNRERLRRILYSSADGGMERTIQGVYQALRSHREELPRFLRGEDEDLWLAAAYFGAGTYALLTRWILEDTGQSPQEVADLLLRLFQR